MKMKIEPRENEIEKRLVKTEQLNDLESERDGLEEGLPLREKLKNVIKRFVFTLTPVL